MGGFGVGGSNHFRLGQIQDGGHFEKLETIIYLKQIIRFTLCTQTDHTDSIATADAYNRRFDTYFVRKGIKRKNEKVDLKKITPEEYTLDWSQFKVFLVCLSLSSLPFQHIDTRCFYRAHVDPMPTSNAIQLCVRSVFEST